MKKSAHQIWKESKEQNLSKEEFKEKLMENNVIVPKNKIMKNTELRIGNYVNIPGLFKKSNVVGIIESISKEEIITDKCEANISLLEPIPLNEEFKEKVFTLFNSEYKIEWKNNRVHIYFNERYLATCDYLHEYQNLHHALTNNELTIKL